jgi:hypothetical protein
MTVLTIIALMCLAFLLACIVLVPTEDGDGKAGAKLVAFIILAIPFAVLLVGLVRG